MTYISCDVYALKHRYRGHEIDHFLGLPLEVLTVEPESMSLLIMRKHAASM